MTWFNSLWRYLTEEEPAPKGQHVVGGDDIARTFGESLAAIGEFGRTVRNNPEAVEVCLALGNLFRAQGEIEKAVEIRKNLIKRPHLSPEFKAWAWFELGRDYKKGGFTERAAQAFEKAWEMSGNDRNVLYETAVLAAECGDFKRAADIYSRLEMPVAEAHYLVRLAQEIEKNDEATALRLLEKALKAYPHSPEALLEIILKAYRLGDWTHFAVTLDSGLRDVCPEMRFILLEGLLRMVSACPIDDPYCETITRDFSTSPGDLAAKTAPDENFVKAVLTVIRALPQDLLIAYYCGWILLCLGKDKEALEWLEKALILNRDFWPARLELLHLSLKEQKLSPAFQVQLEYFLARAGRVKRFVCKQCGLKRSRIFFVCPRCRGWHTIGFRKSLND